MLTVDLGAPPVPNVHLPLPVPGRQELSVRAEGHAAGVARVHVALELLLPHLPEFVPGRPRDDLVVKGLSHEETSRRMESRRRHGVHIRLRDVLDGHGDVVLPYQHLRRWTAWVRVIGVRQQRGKEGERESHTWRAAGKGRRERGNNAEVVRPT